MRFRPLLQGRIVQMQRLGFAQLAHRMLADLSRTELIIQDMLVRTRPQEQKLRCVRRQGWRGSSEILFQLFREYCLLGFRRRQAIVRVCRWHANPIFDRQVQQSDLLFRIR